MLSRNEQLYRLFLEEKKCETRNAREPYLLTEPFCNRTWDSVSCWPDTPAGKVARQQCPHYINMFDHGETATRVCTENGTWWVNPMTGSPWSNYTQCGKSTNEEVPELIQEHLPGIKLMYTIGYSLSLSTLVMALAIMIYFKRLHCARNMIHINMFMAFGFRAAMLLMKNILLVNDLGFANDVNQTGDDVTFIHEGMHWECKLFFTFFYYCILASVMWLLNEGLYLQLILSMSMFADKVKVRWFVLLGWGYPLLFIIPWVICRIYFDDMLCWNLHVNKRLLWILHGPMVAFVAINFAIFINIVRILFTKLTANNCPDSKKVRYRKLAKSTLILIPLFAVYYMGFMWLPDGISPSADLFKIYVEMLFNSFQGFLVALLFCFLNHEVQYEIRKLWRKRSMQSGIASMKNSQSHGLLTHRSAGQIYVDQRKLDPGKHKSARVANGFSTELTQINPRMGNGQYIQTSNNSLRASTSPAFLSERYSQRSNPCNDLPHVHPSTCDDVRQPLVSRSPDGDFEPCNIEVHCSDQVGLDHEVKLNSLCNENYSGPDDSFETTISDQKFEVRYCDTDVTSDYDSPKIICSENEGYSNELAISPISEDNPLIKFHDGEEVPSCLKSITDNSSSSIHTAPYGKDKSQGLNTVLESETDLAED